MKTRSRTTRSTARPRRHAIAPAAAPRLKDRLREATHAAILDAAEQVYVRHGFEGGRMEQVAASAGVSVGTLYNYFADRRALVGSLLEARRAELLRRVDESLATAPADPIEQLRALARSALEHVESHRPFVTLLVQEGVGECDAPRPGRAGSPTTTVLGLQARARGILERARRRGRLRERDLGLLSHLYIGALRAGILYRLTDPDARGAHAIADHIVHYFLGGVALA